MTRTITSNAPGSGTSISSIWKASLGSPSRSSRITHAAIFSGSVPGSTFTSVTSRVAMRENNPPGSKGAGGWYRAAGVASVDRMEADGVFSGGGIKGLAFAGALQAAHEAGYDTWVNVAGTSAGAITAMALAGGDDAPGRRGQLASFDFSKIADTGLPVVGEAENYLFHRGLTHGKVLHEWIEKL